MGFNTTVVVLNDALHQIRDDKEFGVKLYDAVTVVGRGGKDVSAGNHGNAARVIETHHADGLHAVIVGGNTGDDLGYVGNYSLDLGTEEGKRFLLQKMAARFGYSISLRKSNKEVSK